MRLLIIIALFPMFANANEATDKLLQACQKDEKLEPCAKANKVIKHVKKKVERTLENYGIKNAAVVTTSAAKMAIERKIVLTTGKLPVVNNDRSEILIDDENVYLKLKWDIP